MLDRKQIVVETADLNRDEINQIRNSFMNPKHNHLNRELEMDIQDTDTFNGKPVWQNAAAVVLGAVGVYFLAQAWLYHMLVQLITIPKDKWINPLADENCVESKEYPNTFCDVLCNIEITMIHQLSMLRTNFGEEYCKEVDTGKDNG